MNQSESKEKLPKISFVIILLTYLYLNGSLYLIGYWGTFDSLDVSSFISITDIPKYIFQPLNWISGTLLLLVAMGFYYETAVSLLDEIGDRIFKNHPKVKKKKIHFINQILLKLGLSKTAVTLVISGFIICAIGSFLQNNIIAAYILIIFGLFLLIWGVLATFLIPIIRLYISSIFWAWTLMFFFTVTPFISFSTGKFPSLFITKGKHQTLILESKIKEDSLEKNILNGKILLGYIGDKIIISDSSVKIVTILNQSDVTYLTCKEK